MVLSAILTFWHRCSLSQGETNCLGLLMERRKTVASRANCTVKERCLSLIALLLRAALRDLVCTFRRDSSKACRLSEKCARYAEEA
mmetsp:Transcript_5801/g.19777  ORF Transcript_5801/g.19777 Transcript_5801/m.19777 type:complete len:86 (+) Transcript_5801:1395-1652(+)